MADELYFDDYGTGSNLDVGAYMPDAVADVTPLIYEGGDFDSQNGSSVTDLYGNAGDGEVFYDSAFGFDDLGRFADSAAPSQSAFDKIIGSLFGNGSDNGKDGSTLDKVGKWLEEHKTLGGALLTGGAGLLKSMGEQEMLKEQREWLEKQDKEKWNRQMEARKYGTVKPQQFNTGLLSTLKQKQGAQA